MVRQPLPLHVVLLRGRGLHRLRQLDEEAKPGRDVARLHDSRLRHQARRQGRARPDRRRTAVLGIPPGRLRERLRTRVQGLRAHQQPARTGQGRARLRQRGLPLAVRPRAGRGGGHRLRHRRPPQAHGRNRHLQPRPRVRRTQVVPDKSQKSRVKS